MTRVPSGPSFCRLLDPVLLDAGFDSGERSVREGLCARPPAVE